MRTAACAANEVGAMVTAHRADVRDDHDGHRPRAAIVDAQTKKSARERQDESAFNLAEGVLTTAN